MSLSPFDSFQSRFVTYLLNFPHTNTPVHLKITFTAIINTLIYYCQFQLDLQPTAQISNTLIANITLLGEFLTMQLLNC